MVDYCVYLFLLVLFMILSMAMKDVIVVVNMEEVDLYIKRQYTLIFNIVDDVLVVMGEVDIVIRPSTIPLIIQVGLVFH